MYIECSHCETFLHMAAWMLLYISDEMCHIYIYKIKDFPIKFEELYIRSLLVWLSFMQTLRKMLNFFSRSMHTCISLKIIFIYFSLDVFTFKESRSFMSVNYLKMASDSK